MKTKSHATALCVVTQINQSRSVELKLLNIEGWQRVGQVNISNPEPIPTIGTVVAVRHQPFHPRCRQLIQPIYVQARPEVEPHECLLSQLKLNVRSRLRV